ncbi:MAG TPA: ABC transporter substrate-binding protein, partial [Sporosarcina sp.]|nr:ABC transporter substrate-binding protein [Sporosarcina sp.]
MKKSFVLTVLTVLVVGILSACGSSASGNKSVKIGYFPNLTHIATIVALENGYFEEEFGDDVKIETKTVSNGGLFMEAMTTKSIDVGTVGPGPL